MDLGLTDRVSIVTGASRGIGRAIALKLAEEGSHVSIGARSEDDLQDVADACEAEGVRSLAVPCDLSTAEGVSTLVSRTLDEFETVHVLVNNVGDAGNFASFEDVSDEEWLQLYELNVLSVVRATRECLPAMKQQNWGRIINISSESGSQPDPQMPHYNATKAAMKNLTKSLSKQYGDDGILVNTVSPAFVKATPIMTMLEGYAEGKGISLEKAEEEVLEQFRPHIELERAGECEEVANVVAFLASEQASFVHGSDYRVDGGSVASMVG